MDVLFTHCGGLDVHKKTVMACRVTPDPTGEQADGLMELKEFGTMTRTCSLCPTGWLRPGSPMWRWRARDGLLQASFIPPQGQQDLRNLTRYRTKLVRNAAAR